MQFYWLAVGILAVWRLSHLLASEAGPWNVFERIRHWFAGGALGDLVNCFYCLSVWVAAVFAFFLNGTWRTRLLLWPALSAGAIMIERTIHGETFASTPIYYEDQEAQNVLRQEKDTNPIHHS